MLVTIHGVHGYTLVGDDIGMGIVTEYVQWFADKPVVGYLINLTITQLLNLVPVAGEIYIRTPGEVFLVDDVKVQTEFNTSVLDRTYIEG